MTPAAASAVAFFEGLIESIRSGRFVQMDVRTTPHRNPCRRHVWRDEPGEVTHVTRVIALVLGPKPPPSPRPRCRCGSPDGSSVDQVWFAGGWHEGTCPELP